jgi:hypothetical protein
VGEPGVPPRFLGWLRRGDRVELVRVVEDGGLGRPGRTPVVVDSDGVDELGERFAI